MSESIFDKVAKARATQGGSYIQPGDYLFTVEKCKLNDGHKGVSFAMEFRVDEATAKPGLRAPNPVGSRCSAVHNFKHDSTPGNIKAFILAVLGLSESEVSDADFAKTMEECVSDAQPFRGMQVRNSTFQYVVKAEKNLPESQQNPLTLNNFSSVEQTEAEVAARREALDAGVEPETEKPEAPAGLSKFKK